LTFLLLCIDVAVCRAVKGWHLLCGVGRRVVSYPGRERVSQEDIWPWSKHYAECRWGRSQRMCTAGLHGMHSSNTFTDYH